MDSAQIAVTIGGTILVGFILWFFFGTKASTTAREGAAGVQEIGEPVQEGTRPTGSKCGKAARCG